jgi:hypothetical protein
MDAKLLMMSGAAPFEMYPYDAVNSARFDGTTSDYLNFTPGAGNRKLWTFSTWLKRCASTQQDILIAGADSNNKTQITVESSNKINFELVTGGGIVGVRVTTAVLRDPSSWYHIVIVCDSASGTPEDRQQIWLNGVRITSFSTNTTTTLNTDTFFSNSQAMYLGRRSYSTAANLNGYLSQTCFIDGAALTASSFGEDKNGVWVPKDPTGLTFGDEGWLLAYATSSALGDDTSGNGNDWTVNGLAAADQMTDTPSGSNFCTWTPLKFRDPAKLAVLSDGNLAALFDNGTYLEYSWGTMALPAEGKWYWEYKCTAVGGESSYGISGINVPEGNPDVARTYRENGKKYLNMGSATTYGDTFTTNDVIGVAVDMDGGNLYFYKNNTIQASGTAAYTDLLTALPDGGWTPLGAGYNNASVLANFGQTAFAYTPPTGYVALNTANLPEPTIGPNSTTLTSEVFDSILYTGNGTAIGSGGKTISSLAFQPDFTWIKNRDAADSHMLFDASRGVTNHISSDSTAVQVTTAESLTSFTATGFTLGNNVAVNTNTEDYVAWNWKANGAGAANEDGSINTTKTSANTDAGISVITYTGNASYGQTVGHGLGVAPQVVICKNLSNTRNWRVYFETLGATKYINLDDSAVAGTYGSWNDTAPTSSVFSTTDASAADRATNYNGDTFVAYCFAEVEGFSSFSSYTGNGNADGPFIYTGFRPAYVMIKSVSTVHSWWITDTVRNTSNVIGDYLYANLADAEYNAVQMDALSNGFKLRTTGTTTNSSGNEFIYMAFAENPFKYSNAR